MSSRTCGIQPLLQHTVCRVLLHTAHQDVVIRKQCKPPPHTHTHCLESIITDACVCVCTCMRARTHTHTHTHTHVNTYVCTHSYACMYPCTHTLTLFVCLSVCLCLSWSLCLSYSLTLWRCLVVILVLNLKDTETWLIISQTEHRSLKWKWLGTPQRYIIIIMYIYHALISTMSAHMIHINLNMIFYTHVEHSPTKTIYITKKKTEKKER